MMTRPEKAFFLKRRGKTNSEIAAILGYANASSVAQAIKSQLSAEAQMFTSEERQMLIALKYSELEDLRAGVWESALYGDPKSAGIALKVIHEEVGLLQLNAVDSATSQNTVLVVGGAQADYIDKLKQMVED